MAVIDRHPGRTRKQLFTERSGGVKLVAHEVYDDQEEAQFIIDTIASLVRGGDCEPGDCAIMYRTNAQSRVVEEAFIRAGLPYKLVGAQRFYGRKEIKDLLAYLRLVHNPADSVGLLRVINTPPRGVGAKTLEQLNTAAQGAGLTVTQLLLDLGENGGHSRFARDFTGRAGAALGSFGRQLAQWQAMREEVSVADLLDRIVDDTGYRDFINDGTEEGMERWANVLELRGAAAENGDVSLGEFLEQVALVSDQDTLTEASQAPTLLTLHAAKGLEFPVVFIVGLDEGVLPHQRSFDDPESMHEERRLMYVGMTRAKDRLYLLRAFRRSVYGGSDVAEASRFLDDIPEHLLSGNVDRRQSRSESYFKQATRWDGGRRADSDARLTRDSSSVRDTNTALRRRAPEMNPVITQYKAGQRVNHPQFGEGIVIHSKLIGGDEEVDVAFEAVGLKRLAASLAKLEILKG
jgi:DNA helicase-2/ATP-dependent DNA helicase PcrA